MTNFNSQIPISKSRTPCALNHDNLGWSSGATFLFKGVSCGIRVSDDSIWEEAKSALIPFDAQPLDAKAVSLLISIKLGGETSTRGVKNFHIVYDHWTQILKTTKQEELLPFAQYYLFTSIADYSDNFYMPLASSFSLNNRGVLVLSDSLEQRIELLKSLHQKEDDYNYFSTTVASLKNDILQKHPEFAVLDPKERKKIYVSPESLGYSKTEGPNSSPLALVVNLSQEATKVEQLKPSEASLRLCNASTRLRVSPQEVLPQISEIVNQVPFYELPSSPQPDPKSISQILSSL